jgi:tetratricopeptide (TPR) repeat protein
MGAVYQAQQNYDRAMRTYQMAMRIAETNGDVTNQFRAMDGMIATLNDSKQYAKAADMLVRRLDMALAYNNTREEMLSLRYLGQFHQWAGNYPIAKRYYQEALTVASQLDDSLQAGQLRVRLASFEMDNFSPPGE